MGGSAFEVRPSGPLLVSPKPERDGTCGSVDNIMDSRAILRMDTGFQVGVYDGHARVLYRIHVFWACQTC